MGEDTAHTLDTRAGCWAREDSRGGREERGTSRRPGSRVAEVVGGIVQGGRVDTEKRGDIGAHPHPKGGTGGGRRRRRGGQRRRSAGGEVQRLTEGRERREEWEPWEGEGCQCIPG